MMMSVAVTSTRTTVRPVGTRPSCGSTVVRFAIESTVAHTGSDSTPSSVMSLPVRVPTRSVGRTSLGGRGGGWGMGEERETLAQSLHVGLLFCPTAEERLGMEGTWEPVQLVNFSRREKAPREFGPIGLLPDQFDINANLGIRGDRDEGEVG